MPDYSFISIADRASFPDNLTNTFVLQGDNWNDFGSTLRFDLVHFDSIGARSKIGKVKFLHRTLYGTKPSVDRETKLPDSFSELGEDYISLGQSEDYYEDLSALLGIEKAIGVLRALRDIAEMPGLAVEFETLPPFRNGMMRENTAQRARRFGSSWVRRNEVHLKPAFCYATQIGGGSIATEASFDFAVSNKLPSRIVAIIGRNAVGKTLFLSQLASDLAQIDRISEERQTLKLERFPEGRPVFARVIAVSYSAFDRFRRPEVTPFSSYVYCGIRDERGNISQRALNQSYNRNRARIREHDRHEEWIENILEILGNADGLSEPRLREEIDDDEGTRLLNELSSGQAILVHFVTALLAWIEHESIVLFDEPETHLHPNAVANLFVVLSDILKRHQSYAVVATHSPVVLQEMPSRRVVNFVREAETTTAEPLPIESFGESVTELTRHVFKTFEVDSLYKQVLKDLARDLPPEAVLALFPNGLGLAAQSYLLGQYAAAERR